VLALLAMLAVIAGDFRAAFIWLGAQIVVDATDGLLARALRVKERLPYFDGAKLDDIVDYLCYVFVPVLIVLQAGLLPPRWGVAVGGAVLMSSGYGFCQAAAKVKSTDYFFTGFPSYWNLLAFYLFLLDWPAIVNAAVLLLFALLVFVPLRYVYPSRTQTFNVVTNSLGILWALMMVWIVWRLPDKNGLWVWLTLIYPLYYLLLSLWLDHRSRANS
jgi:phosphatidylcholine synthase